MNKTKKLLLSIAFTGIVASNLLFAIEVSQEEMNKWQEQGVYSTYDIEKLHELGVKSLEEFKKWNKIYKSSKGYHSSRGDIHYGIIKDLNSYGVYTPEQYKQFEAEKKKWTDARIYDIKGWKQLGLTLDKVKQWKKAGFTSIYTVEPWLKVNITDPLIAKDYKNSGIRASEVKNLSIPLDEINKWRDAGIHISYIGKWKELGINDPKEIKQWQNTKMGNDEIMKAIKLGFDYKTTKQWSDYGIREVKNISLLNKEGFTKPSQYEPYKRVYLEHAIKLKKWNIKPNKLIESMSYSNLIFNKELYFTNKDIFNKAYSSLKDNCNEITKDKWFTSIDMSQNKNKCYIFVGKMIQRVDEKSTFGRITQKGLVSGTGRRYFFAESFTGDWKQNYTKVGVIKGSGSFSYNSRNGQRVVPKGTVIYLD